MNKTRKTFGESTPPDPLFVAGEPGNLEVKPSRAPHLIEPFQETLRVWKPFTQERVSTQEEATWFSLTFDLLHNFDQIASFFYYELMGRSWMNAYLLAAGMNQMMEDYLHSDLLTISKILKHLRKIPGPVGSFLTRSSPGIYKTWSRLNENRKTIRTLVEWQLKLADLLDRLARIVISNDSPDPVSINRILADGGSLITNVGDFPTPLREMIIKLPSCFRSFDQQPEDMRRIVDEFSIHWPEYNKPILVVGIRTSGSYLAPLYMAFLKANGYEDVSVLTLRPDTPLSESEYCVLQEATQKDSLVMICDDPPTSGNTLMKSALQLEEVGIPRRNIILLLQLFGNYDSLPDTLQKYPSILLSWSNWNVHRQLELSRVKEVLVNACAAPFVLSDLQRVPYLGSIDKRDHAKALYQAQLLNTVTSQVIPCSIQAVGVGLGYFGEHELTIAQKLADYSAPIITLQNGLLFQEVSAPDKTLADSIVTREEHWIDHMVNYVVERNQQLPVPEDTGLKLVGRSAVWEVASDLLGSRFGRGRLIARMLLIDSYIKGLLRAQHPSIIDGDMSLHHWYFQNMSGRSFMKTHMADKDFSHLDLACYDPVFDLAGLAVELEQGLQPVVIRNMYEAATQTKIPPETWMLYQLIHLWNSKRQDGEKSAPLDRRMSLVVQRYYAGIYFEDLNVIEEGPLCSIDIDGVLESKLLGFSSLSPDSARSLRALNLHGYRVILATGRSLEELEERCATYKLCGGVAEYGAVVYDHSSGQVKVLLSDEELETLYKVRSKLSNKRGVFLDNDYRFSVRAYCLDGDGRRTRLDDESIEQVLLETATAVQVYAIQGVAQTDFMVKRIDKGVGLKEWLASFDHSINDIDGEIQTSHPIRFAVGDSATDLPMFQLAALSFAPANASPEVKQAKIVETTHSVQRGMEQAVTRLIGHKPGSCSICRLGELSAHTQFMQELLVTNENGRLGMLWELARLFVTNGGRLHVSP